MSRLITQRRGRDSNPRWTKPPIPVFETGAFNRSATSPASERLAAGREEAPQEVGAFLGQEPGLDLRAMVQLGHVEHVEHAAGGAGLWIGGAEHDSREAREHD